MRLCSDVHSWEVMGGGWYIGAIPQQPTEHDEKFFGYIFYVDSDHFTTSTILPTDVIYLFYFISPFLNSVISTPLIMTFIGDIMT